MTDLPSLNSRHFTPKCLFYRCFGVFYFARDVNMMLPEKVIYFLYLKWRVVAYLDYLENK